MSAQRGQATVDYVALVAVVVLLLVAAAAAAGIGAPGIANAVVAQVHRVLCVVTGETCRVDIAPPCTVVSRRDTHRSNADILLVRIDRDRYVLREQLSDGTVRLTEATHHAGGVQIGLRTPAKLAKAGEGVPKPDGVSGAIELLAGSGRVFLARDAAEAGTILRAIRRDGAGLPPPRELFYEGGLRTLGSAGLGALVADAGVDGGTDSVIGVRVDRASGARTIYLSLGGTAHALAEALQTGPAWKGAERVIAGLTIDPAGHEAALTLSGSSSSMTGASGVQDEVVKGTRREFIAHVDLTDPEVAAAWARYRHDPANLAATIAFADRLRGRARVDTRLYDTSSTTNGVGGDFGEILLIGGEVLDTTDTARLKSAATRPPGGVWEPRLDCV